MAWNEPGNNDKDPWKKKGGNNQGPPDLDDLLKDLGNKFGGIFGGKSSGGNNSGKSISGIGLTIALVVAILVYVFSGFYTIKESETGINLRFGQYTGYVEPGLRWKWTFIDRIIPVDIQSTRDRW